VVQAIPLVKPTRRQASEKRAQKSKLVAKREATKKEYRKLFEKGGNRGKGVDSPSATMKWKIKSRKPEVLSTDGKWATKAQPWKRNTENGWVGKARETGSVSGK